MSRGRIWLGSVVRSIQLGLVDAGADIDPDGQFGANTIAALKAFQQEQGLLDTGVANKATWTALAPHIHDATAESRDVIEANLPKFRGDLGWVHQQEGHNGGAYWPGTASGVTLDPGVDVGHAELALVEELYEPLLTPAQLQALRDVAGITGTAAKAAIDGSPVLQSIAISREQAEALMPFAAASYWSAITARFGALRKAKTLPSIQTVLLSLAYNRGAGNSHLQPLGELLDAGDWIGTARRIGTMQQSHPAEGIRIRRRRERDLVLAEIEFLEA